MRCDRFCFPQVSTEPSGELVIETYRLKSMSQETDSFHEGLATALVRGHEDLMAQLVEMRQTKGITQGTVAARMGVTQPTVAAFEAHDSNPTLATLRRYALAVRASISYTVEDADPEGRLTTVI